VIKFLSTPKLYTYTLNGPLTRERKRRYTTGQMNEKERIVASMKPRDALWVVVGVVAFVLLAKLCA